jgi:hypothetical protein
MVVWDLISILGIKKYLISALSEESDVLFCELCLSDE